MANYKPDTESAYQDLHIEPDIEGTSPMTLMKSAAFRSHEESQVKLLSQPTTPLVGERAPSVSDDSDSTPEKSVEIGATHLTWQHWSWSGFWSTVSHLAIISIVIGLTLTSVLGSKMIIGYSAFEYDICDSGGNFNFNGLGSFWLPSRAFEITLAFGNFTFSNAKLVDVLWDVVTCSSRPAQNNLLTRIPDYWTWWTSRGDLHQLQSLFKVSHHYHGTVLCHVRHL